MSRKIVEDVLTKRDTVEIWGAGYRSALPITPQGFSLGSVLPAVLYMMRWGHRRGKGKFGEVYGKKGDSKDRATISQVANLLSSQTNWFADFDTPQVQEKAKQALREMLLVKRRFALAVYNHAKEETE